MGLFFDFYQLLYVYSGWTVSLYLGNVNIFFVVGHLSKNKMDSLNIHFLWLKINRAGWFDGCWWVLEYLGQTEVFYFFQQGSFVRDCTLVFNFQAKLKEKELGQLGTSS